MKHLTKIILAHVTKACLSMAGQRGNGGGALVLLLHTVSVLVAAGTEDLQVHLLV